MRYALIKGGLVHSVFESALPKESYPDIAHLLEEIAPEVKSNWKRVDGVFVPPQPAAQEPTEQEKLIAALEKAGVMTKEQREAIETEIKSVAALDVGVK